MGLSELEALQHYKLAPLPARRDIAMLGLLHRACHGRAPGPLSRLLLAGSARQVSVHAAITRAAPLRHHLQLTEYVNRASGRHTETLRRSCFGLVTVWNKLPAHVATAPSTRLCQRKLQQCLINIALASRDINWPHFFLEDARVLPIHAFQKLFD